MNGVLVEILDVSLATLDEGALWGRHVEAPAAGALIEGARFPIVGWTLGKQDPVVAVELTDESGVFTRVAVDVARPDVGAVFPQAADAERAGFRTSASVA